MNDISTVIKETKAAAMAYAKAKRFTKQQAIAFTILSIHEKDINITTAMEAVCGPNALTTIDDVAYTAEQLTQAVIDSFFDA